MQDNASSRKQLVLCSTWGMDQVNHCLFMVCGLPVVNANVKKKKQAKAEPPFPPYLYSAPHATMCSFTFSGRQKGPRISPAAASLLPAASAALLLRCRLNAPMHSSPRCFLPPQLILLEAAINTKDPLMIDSWQLTTDNTKMGDHKTWNK